VQAGGPPLQVAVRRDPTFGPLLRVGLGGSAVAGAIPLSADDAAELLERLVPRPLPSFDAQAVVELLVRLSRLAVAEPAIDIELEGVVVHARGHGVTVAGARFIGESP
jgi:hypothetical protein